MKFFGLLAALRKHLSKDIDIQNFDPNFYIRYYPDLSGLKQPKALRRHYFLHGKKEGRFRNFAEFVSHFEQLHGKLPDGFDPAEYRLAHLDLQKAGIQDWEAVEHYLRFGRREGRSTFRFNCDIYRELYFNNQTISDRELQSDFAERGRREGKIGSGADILKAKGIKGGGRWIEALKTDEFTLLNYTWAATVATRMDAVDAMLSRGISLLSPISFALEFDAEFYREVHPDLVTASDEDTYRHWLFVGFEQGEPGSPPQFFADLGVPLTTFPTSFGWQRYLNRCSIEGTRWAALRHFIVEGFGRGIRPVEGPDAGAFFAALGNYFKYKNDVLAIEAFVLAQSLGALKGHSIQNLADCHFRRQQWSPALELYQSRVRGSGPNVWSYCNGARAALKLNKIDEAFEILAAGKDNVAGSPVWRKVLLEAINAEFEVASSKTNEFLKLRMRSAANKTITEAVAQVAKRFANFDPLGVALPVAPNAKVVVLANVDLRQCTHYRVEQKEQLFEALGREYEIFPASEVDDFISALPGAAAAIFYRLPAFPMNVRAIEVARALAIPTYYDIDDLIFDSAEYPEPFETYGGAIDRGFYELLQFGVPLFRAAMSLCDYGIASTSSLAGHMKPIVRKHEVFVLPNGLDNRNLPFLDSPPLRVRRDDSIMIFYGSGTKAHNSDFVDLAGPAIVEIMKRHPRVKLMVVGYLTLDASFEPFRDRIIGVPWVPDVKSYWSLLAEADINVAVLASYATTDAKSEIKWLEAAAMDIPSVVSGTARYKEVLDDGVDVLMADDPESWTAALERLVADPALRKRVARCARDKAATLYSLEANAKIFAAMFPPLFQTQQKPFALTHAKRRVLLVNIFFHPQTVGGSPRVVRDNLDCFLDGDAKRDFDFGVVTTDFGGEGSNLIRVEDYRGCPVFRVSPPDVPNLEWWSSHPTMGKAFRDILDIWRPDLVHFHCVERLSAAVVEECLKANIPYITMLHDAWWISDWQFLTDMKDRLREPGESWPFDPPPPVSVGEALDRRRMLTPLLASSDAILGVSKAFTEIYRSCGFDNAIAVPNGVPSLISLHRIASTTGRVRLAHIGSMTKFKGFFLVQAVLKLGHFRNLELTVVDHSRYGGDVDLLTWGGTPVRIVGKTMPERMHEIYGQHDVLLAPSLWAEPFGLVTREALSAGLWVVASDRGAIGEDVTHGVNGWVIDVETPQSLLAVLSEIDSNPTKYVKSPPVMPLRGANEQADELLKIYRDVLARPRAPKQQPYLRKTVEKGLRGQSRGDFNLRSRAAI
ncbi:MAG: glycosyltransferase [Pseudomonadota bacterium]|nr:glycosyltransferase [Pseudomonadota bacterium]